MIGPLWDDIDFFCQNVDPASIEHEKFILVRRPLISH